MSEITHRTEGSFSPVRGWVWQFTLLSFILGVLLALALQTQHRFSGQGLPPRYSALANRYFELETSNRDSEKEIKNLRSDITRLESALVAARSGADRTQLQALSEQLRDAKRFAGLTPVEGPGVEVILTDAPNGAELAKEQAGGQDQGAEYQNQLSNFLVHDQDVVGVVNELKNAGAEAIAVNSQRLVATSSIRCVGTILYINQRPTGGAAPYVVTAIGSPRELEGALTLSGGFLDTQMLLANQMVIIRRKDRIVVPEYTGLIEFEYAKSVPVKKKAPLPEKALQRR